MKLVERTLEATMIQRPEPTADQPQNMCLDKGYDYPEVRELVAAWGYTGHIRSRGEERVDKGTIPGYRARRWVVATNPQLAEPVQASADPLGEKKWRTMWLCCISLAPGLLSAPAGLLDRLLVVRGEKRFETRSWYTDFRGTLAIHASKGFPLWAQSLLLDDGPFREALNCPPDALHRGTILGTVCLKACRTTEMTLSAGALSDQEIAFGDWHKGRYAWEFEKPVWLQIPIPVKGMLGLWTVPMAIEIQVNQQLSGRV